MTVYTNTAVLAEHGYNDTNIELPEWEVKIISATQRQGDVLLLKVTTTHAGKPIGKGVEVVRSEAGGNTHTLHGEGLWQAATSADDLVQGWLTVAPGKEAFLIHSEEHSALGIGAGTFEVRTQREFAGEWRRVAD